MKNEATPNPSAMYQVLVSDAMRIQAQQSAPIRQQFYPNTAELDIKAYEMADPIGDQRHAVSKHLVHRYVNRVLWKVSPVCAVYCRFCFRKEFIGKKGQSIPISEREKDIQYLKAHQEIDEVILSGGDPLMLSAQRLNGFLSPLKDMPHIRRIRIHTRVPVVAPHLVTDQLISLLSDLPQTVVMVLHINHSDELQAQADKAIEKLHGKMLLTSQSVLLKEINNDAQTLKRLMDDLLDRQIKPYYLHHLDVAKGTDHFRVSIAEGKWIYAELRRITSGIAVPTYIVEIPDGGGKIPVMELTDEQTQYLFDLGIT